MCMLHGTTFAKTRNIMSPLLNNKIIASRQKYAPELKSLLEKIEKLAGYLESIKINSAHINFSLENIDITTALMVELERRINNAYNRFSKGEITISIAGLEKAGKSTFINNLLKSNDSEPDIITTDASRCTSVPINIRWGKTKQFEIEYHQSPNSFLNEVINPLIEDGYNKEAGVSAPIPLFSTLEQFKSYDFKKINVAQGSLASIVFEKLIAYQNHVAEIKKTIGLSKLTEKDISKLARYSAHINISDEQKAHQACIRECTLIYPFDGGSEHLKLADTPGVDDPNPNARTRTLATIGNSTDLLVVLSKPDNKPTLTAGHTRFYDSISKLNQTNTFPLRNKSCVIVNRTKFGHDGDTQDHVENVLTHISNLKKWEDVRVFDEHFCLCERDQARSAFNKINSFLELHLHDADRHEVERFYVDFKNLLKMVFGTIALWDNKLPKDQSSPDFILDEFNRWTNAFKEYLKFALGGARNSLINEEFIKKANSYSKSWFAEIVKVIESFETSTQEKLSEVGVARGTSCPIDFEKRDLEEKLRFALRGFAGKDISEFISHVEAYIFNLCFPLKFSSPKVKSISFNLRNKIEDLGTIDQLVALLERKSVFQDTENNFSSFIFLLTSLRKFSADSGSGILKHSLRPAFALLNPTIAERNKAFERFISDYHIENQRLGDAHSVGVFDFFALNNEDKKFKYYSFQGEIPQSPGDRILKKLSDSGLLKLESFPAIQLVSSLLKQETFGSKQMEIPAQTRELLNIRIGAANKTTLHTKIPIKKSGKYFVWLKYSCAKDVGKITLSVRELSPHGAVGKCCLENFEVHVPTTKKHEVLVWTRLNTEPMIFSEGNTYQFEFANNEDDVNFSGLRLECADATTLEDDLRTIVNEPMAGIPSQLREFSVLKTAVQRYFEILMQRQEFNYVEIAEDYIADVHLQLTSRDDSEVFEALLRFFRSHRDVLCSPDVDQTHNAAISQVHSDLRGIRHSFGSEPLGV